MIIPKIKIPENVSNTYTLSEPTATTKNELAEWVCDGLEKIKEKYLFEMCSESLRIKIENEVNRLIEMCENRMLEIGLIQHYPFNNKQYCFINFVDVISSAYHRVYGASFVQSSFRSRVPFHS